VRQALKVSALCVMVVFLITTFSLIGCKTAAPATTAAAETTAAGETTAALSGKLEVFSWWTAGGEAEGLAALIKIYKEKFPNVEFINATVSGGAGVNAKPMLATRMAGGDPPDSFQVHAGHELIDTWGAAGLLEPVNFIFEEEGWLDAYPDDMINILSSGKDILSVPVNIHRDNILWYNKAVFEKIGVKPPTTFDEFFTVAEKLKKEGITPLALGDSNIVLGLELLEVVLLGVLGPEDYKGLFDGTVKWDSEKVKEGITTFVKVLDYVNKDHSAINNIEAAQYVSDGTAAMTIDGDWLDGYYKSKGLTPNKEFGYLPSPGTAGSFNALSDTFCLPKNVKNRPAVIEWLKICGSKEGQDAFNPLKGSIPARTDPDISLYDEYLKFSIEEYAKDIITPSIAHGAAVSETWVADILDVVTMLVANKNVADAATSFQAAADKNLKK